MKLPFRRREPRLSIHDKESWSEGPDGVLHKVVIRGHKCPTPGDFFERPKEKGQHYRERERYATGSFWDCPECGRTYRYGQMRDAYDKSWQLLFFYNYVQWSKYRKARYGKTTKIVSQEEDV